eukprot:CAMPEP_0119138372 /NCGR_PEP_ID=MMETSP1310-20130426/25507_1 /TAXON_ID=464262 /ORGANISM="Genus nov. species nov., Strain RCC2339" /LENGTH=53 /DNA_ID=CAMNT_0007129555 /DNA_START=51 /DNA_END=209 /DNA_ORIENTATION=+
MTGGGRRAPSTVAGRDSEEKPSGRPGVTTAIAAGAAAVAGAAVVVTGGAVVTG